MLKFINLVKGKERGEERRSSNIFLFFSPILFLIWDNNIKKRVIGNENERGDMTEVKGGK